MKAIRFEIKETGAPYPNQCWWRIRSKNGKILSASETMGKRNAARVICRVVAAIKRGDFEIILKKPGKQK